MVLNHFFFFYINKVLDEYLKRVIYDQKKGWWLIVFLSINSMYFSVLFSGRGSFVILGHTSSSFKSVTMCDQLIILAIIVLYVFRSRSFFPHKKKLVGAIIILLVLKFVSYHLFHDEDWGMLKILKYLPNRRIKTNWWTTK